jgi:hypothetical protein
MKMAQAGLVLVQLKEHHVYACSIYQVIGGCAGAGE